METGSWFIFLLCALLAEIVGSMAGFGAATILSPMAALLMDVKRAIALVAGFHLMGNACRLIFFGYAIDWKVWRRFGLTAVLASVVGVQVAAGLPSPVIVLCLGLFLVGYVAFDRWWPGGIRLPQRSATLATGGVVSGFVAGLIGTGGAIRSACLLAFGLPKERYLGTSAAIALMVDATRLSLYVMEGFVPRQGFAVILSLMLVAFTGAWLGQRWIRRVRAEVFHLWVRVLLGCMGLKFVIDGGMWLLGRK